MIQLAAVTTATTLSRRDRAQAEAMQNTRFTVHAEPIAVAKARLDLALIYRLFFGA